LVTPASPESTLQIRLVTPLFRFGFPSFSMPVGIPLARHLASNIGPACGNSPLRFVT
jgi:hypothetical protein